MPVETALFGQWLALVTSLWWPFCRTLALISAAPVVGENMVPITVRVLLSLVLAVVLLPVAQPAAHIEPFSLAAVGATFGQVLVGLSLGLAFHLTMAVVTVLGYTVSSQMALAMALMNDPVNGTSSDVVSAILTVLSILVFFAIDGHLVVVGVIGASFNAWPVGGGIPPIALETLVHSVAWVFAAALLLAAPVIFSVFVVQIGFGLLNRVAPALNLFSLGFSLTTIFGLFMLGHVVRFLPEHYIGMTRQVLGMLARQLRG